MTIKKMMLFASALAALVAFAAPAAASAHLQWYTDPGNVLLEGEEELHVVGELSTSVPASGLVNELCPVTFTGTASNTGPEGAAHGVLNGGNVNEGEECATNVSFAGCNVEEATLNFGTSGWTLTTSTPDHVTIDNATFTNFYTAGCAAFKIPHVVPASGSVEGTLTNNAGPNGEDCISFEESTGLAVEGGGPAVTLDGEVCITLPLTLH
jgi:hypothetical protein